MIYKITYQDVKTVKSVMRTDDDYKHMYLLEGQIAGFEKEWIDEDIGGIILFQTSPLLGWDIWTFIRYLYSPRWCSIRVYPWKSCRRECSGICDLRWGMGDCEIKRLWLK